MQPTRAGDHIAELIDLWGSVGMIGDAIGLLGSLMFFGTGAWYEPPNSDEDPVLNLPWMVVPSLETKSWMV